MQLHLVHEPCNRKFTWTQVGSSAIGGPPPARYDHSVRNIAIVWLYRCLHVADRVLCSLSLSHALQALVRGDVMYIFGGTSVGRLADLWAYTATTNKWIQLDVVKYSAPR